MYFRQIQRLLKSAVVRSQSIQQIQPISNLNIAQPLLAQLPHEFLLTTAHTLSHQRQRLTHCLNRRVVVQQLRIHSAKLQVVTRQLLVHLQPRRVRRTSRVQSAALRRCLANEIVVVEDDTLEVIAAVIQLPQLLVNRSLIVQNCYYQLLTQVLPWTRRVLQHLLSLPQVHQRELELLLLIQVDLGLADVGQIGYRSREPLCIEENAPRSFIICCISPDLVLILSRNYTHSRSSSSLENT